MASVTATTAEIVSPALESAEPGLYEVVGGQIVEKPAMSVLASVVATVLVRWMAAYVDEQQLGRVASETLFLLDPRSASSVGLIWPLSQPSAGRSIASYKKPRPGTSFPISPSKSSARPTARHRWPRRLTSTSAPASVRSGWSIRALGRFTCMTLRPAPGFFRKAMTSMAAPC